MADEGALWRDVLPFAGNMTVSTSDDEYREMRGGGQETRLVALVVTALLVGPAEVGCGRGYISERG